MNASTRQINPVSFHLKQYNPNRFILYPLILLLIILHFKPINCFICDQQCICIQSSGKFTANCTNTGIEQLPSCQKFDSDFQEKLKRIHVLSLGRNNLKQLQANIFRDACLVNLQKLYLPQAQISAIDDKAFNPLTNIIELSLSENLLTSIPTKALEKLILLQTLDLSTNQINELSNNSFKSLVNLRKLFLNDNNISFVDVNSFAGLTSIQVINLSSNRFTILQPESFVFLKSLHSLYLEGNKWNCDCRMQPFKRMLLLKPRIQIHDRPKCSTTSVDWSQRALDHFQCPPKIFRNITETELTVSEGSTMRLRCAIYIETFGRKETDKDYLLSSKINWYWNNVQITNNSKGCDQNCRNIVNHHSHQHFQIDEAIETYDSITTLKISNLALYSIMTINEGNYRCSVVNNAGSDEQFYHVNVVPYYSNSYYEQPHKISPVLPSSDLQVSYKNHVNTNSENSDHILFGLVLGIFSGLFLVLVIFSIMFIFFFRKPKIVPHPQELAMIDASTDNNTIDENHETNTETTERNASQNEFNPLLIVNPVKKPPRLGIPDVSSIYSNPSWTMNRANMNRSRYASYAEPIYSEYHTLYRPNRNGQILRIDNNTFISDTASEV